MKVYVVQADNLRVFPQGRWTEGVFYSKELAEQYIEKKEVRYKTDMDRIGELDKLCCNYRITEEEYAKVCSLKAYWLKAGDCCPNYWIEEYEMI